MYPGVISLGVNEIMAQISKRYALFFMENEDQLQATILHMPWQLSYHGMCIRVAWLDC